MLTGIHFLLTYQCTSECDHCFLHCSPRAEGTFTLEQVRRVYEEIAKIGTIEDVYFEGGEPFLFYPLMIEAIRLGRQHGLNAGVVTNSYWATSVEDAGVWLKPLKELEIFDLSLSDDLFHHDDTDDYPAKRTLTAAIELGIPAATICIDPATTVTDSEDSQGKGEPVIGGGVKFRGRAVDKLVEGLPRRSWKTLTTCPHEDLEDPQRVHVDAYGNVHLCQGLGFGNMWETPLSTLIKNYRPHSHPICAPLLKGGPAELAKKYGCQLADGYCDECHLCYLVRRKLLDKFPQYLAPKQVYGLEDNSRSGLR